MNNYQLVTVHHFLFHYNDDVESRMTAPHNHERLAIERPVLWIELYMFLCLQLSQQEKRKRRVQHERERRRLEELELKLAEDARYANVDAPWVADGGTHDLFRSVYVPADSRISNDYS